ncbi:hypothetical protein Tco_1194526 [Tanacetum coccineum]
MTIRRRTRVDPNLLNNFEEIHMAANGNGDDGLPPAGAGLPVPDLRTMEESMFDEASSSILCQNLQFYWTQTSHTNSSNEILKPFFGKGFSKHPSMDVIGTGVLHGLHEIAMDD